MLKIGDKVRAIDGNGIFDDGDVFEITRATDKFIGGKRLNDSAFLSSVFFGGRDALEGAFEKIREPENEEDGKDDRNKRIAKYIEELDDAISKIYDKCDAIKEKLEATYKQVDDVVGVFEKIINDCDE